MVIPMKSFYHKKNVNNQAILPFKAIKRIFSGNNLSLPDYDRSVHGDLIAFTVPDRFENLENYWVNEPYVMIAILFDKMLKILKYQIIEPALTLFEKHLLERIYDDLQDILTIEDISKNEDKKTVLSKKTAELLRRYRIDFDDTSIFKILYYLQRNYIGFGKIDPLMRDARIEDISCDGNGIPLFLYHRTYQNIQTSISFDERELNSLVIKLCQMSGKQISIGEPIVNSTLPEGSRLQATLGHEVTDRGSTFTIRKFREEPFTPIDLIKLGTGNLDMMVYFWFGVDNNKNMIFAGGTASGKTSMLNAVSLFLPPQAKVVSIEDTRELVIQNDNWIPGITRDSFIVGGTGEVNMFELLKTALRQRPEYLIVGEVRGKEALTLFQAMSTGHAGYSTIHAGDLTDVVNRLESDPINVPHSMLQALDTLCLQINTFYNGKRVRRIKQIVEITGLDPITENIRINEIFRWDPATDTFRQSNISHLYEVIMQERGWTREQFNCELENRKRVMEFLFNENIQNYVEFSRIIQEYSIDPENVLKNIQAI